MNQHGPSSISIHVYVCIVSFGILQRHIPVGLSSCCHCSRYDCQSGTVWRQQFNPIVDEFRIAGRGELPTGYSSALDVPLT